MRTIGLIVSSITVFACATPLFAQTSDRPLPSIERQMQCALLPISARPADCPSDGVAESSQTVDVRGFRIVTGRPTDGASPAALPSVRKPAIASRLAVSRSRVDKAQAVRPEPGLRIEFRVKFETGSDALLADGKAVLDGVARYMSLPEASAQRLRVEGHTDSIGSRAYNLGLSRRRAESVVRYLTSVGVEAGRLQSRGYGFDIPRAGSNPADAGNRRVEFAVIQDNQSARAELPGSES